MITYLTGDATDPQRRITEMAFQVCTTRCKNCLFSEERLVSPGRFQDILRDCRTRDVHFICHNFGASTHFVSGIDDPDETFVFETEDGEIMTQSGTVYQHSLENDVCCRGFYDACLRIGQLRRIAERLGTVIFVDQPTDDGVNLVSWKAIQEARKL